jgi:hypothetical protein
MQVSPLALVDPRSQGRPGTLGGGRMGGDVVRSERRVASLAVITKLVELGYLQPGARHRATAVEWAIDRLRMDLVGGSPAGAEAGLGHGRLGRDRPAAGAGGCGPPDRPGRDRQGENCQKQRGPPLDDRQGALEIRCRVRRVRLSARATTKGHCCRL